MLDWAPTIIHSLIQAKSEPGIIIRGKRAFVDRAFSQGSNNVQRNSRPFAQAFQGLVRAAHEGGSSAMDARRAFGAHNYDYHYAMRANLSQNCDSSAAQMHYPMQASQQYGNLCYDGQPVYLPQQAAQGVAHNVSFRHAPILGELRKRSRC